MIAAYYGKVEDDDEYNAVRCFYGDTTSTQAQLSALSKLGLKPAFKTSGRVEDLIEEIRQGRPVAVGWLHKGPSSSPSGGGHWSVITGYTYNSFIVNDPYGEANLAYGGYVNNTKGNGISYSFKNWCPRWEVEGAGTGWYLTCQGN